MTTSAPLASVAIVGTGLIGTSIGLALTQAGVLTYLADQDPHARDAAVAMGAGRAWAQERVEHAIIAVPPTQVAAELIRVLRSNLALSASDVCSVKTKPLAEIEALTSDSSGSSGSVLRSRICLAHPIAGRERGGATSAQPDLFVDRPWVLCPLPESSLEAIAAARAVAAAVGAAAVEMSPREHDVLLARLSHVPQLVSSATAAALQGLDSGLAAVAGQGVRDVIRLAGSDPRLWGEIVAANASAVAAALGPVIGRLSALQDACDGPADTLAAVVEALIADGRDGRANLPVKPGASRAPWVVVDIVVPDRPGELARLFAAVGAAEINVEDIAMEHGVAQPAGVVHLSVIPESVERLVDIATAEGWHCTPRKDDSAT